MDDVHEGGCLCGNVRYRTIGSPVWTTICHCSFCQRLTGSAFLVEPVFLRGNVQIQSGTVMTYDHVSPAHGRKLTVNFCPRCGTHLSLLFERFPSVQGVCGGTFDDPDWIEPDRHIFTDSAVDWMTFPAEASCFRQHAIKEDGTPEMPWKASI